MHAPNLAAPLTSLVSLATAVTAARPSLAGDGVDITPWIVGGKFQSTIANLHIQADGADRTIADPTTGTEGVEVWVYKPDRGGTLRWWRAGVLNSGADIVVKNPGGFVAMVTIPPGSQRVHVAGTPSAGAPTFYIEPVEQYT